MLWKANNQNLFNKSDKNKGGKIDNDEFSHFYAEEIENSKNQNINLFIRVRSSFKVKDAMANKMNIFYGLCHL
jgi:hypothetical protein